MKLKYYELLEVWQSILALRKQKLKSYKAVQELDDTYESILGEINWLREQELKLRDEYAIFENGMPVIINREYKSDKKEEWVSKRKELLDTETRELIPLKQDLMQQIIDFSMCAEECSALKLIIKEDKNDGESNNS